jgi:tellurite resistance protein TerC
MPTDARCSRRADLLGSSPVWWLWIGFIVLIGLLLAFDLGVFHRTAHVVEVREALIWSGVWVGLSLLFNVFIYFGYERHWLGMDLPNAEPDGQTAAVAFFTGYLLEKSLSVDNIFIIAVIFGFFAVPAALQHRLLFWGILAALLMRGVMIVVGVALIERFHWILYGFGAILIVTAVRMLFADHQQGVQENRLVRLVRKVFPVTDDYEGAHFIVVKDGRHLLTPLALALVAVESADLVLAVDSIPAIFSVTENPFLIFTSNVFAILGLRSLYFALAHIMDRLHYLNRSLAGILALIGVKMLLKDVLHAVPGLMYYTLGAIVLFLAAGVIASLIWTKPDSKRG